MVVASASAKTILFGEHAVVYGYPAIATPLSELRVSISIYRDEFASGLRIYSTSTDLQIELFRDRVPEYSNGLANVVWRFLKESKEFPAGISMQVDSDIPVAAGFGSGAALATGIIRGLSLLLDNHLDLARLNALVFEVEKHYHGTPSGIDNTVIVYERPTYFVLDESIEVFDVVSLYYLLVADSGIKSSTRKVVEDVCLLRSNAPAEVDSLLASIGDIVIDARSILKLAPVNMSALGELMVDNHRLLRQLTVSCDVLDRLVNSAISAGASGAKLSGAGRGGNVVALVAQDAVLEVEVALRAAGAVNVYKTRLNFVS